MSISFNFDTTYLNLPRQFYEQVNPTPVKSPRLIAFNRDLASGLKLDISNLSDQQIAEIFSGNVLPEDAQPIAMAYAGHQFAHFVPQLGDGRAILLGEVVAENGKHYDIQLKGAGPTPFSRSGDGRSSLGPVLREYILSEAMYHLGVPTTRALAAVRTGEDVYREEAIPGGVFTRVSSSHIRVGTFEYFAAREDKESLKLLLEYCVNRYYPRLKGEKSLAIPFLIEVIHGQAELVAQWMELGFIHGVMNTDNCSVAGLTIDYGPCAFMDEFRIDKVFSSIDRRGRYAYGNQANIAFWNMGRLAESLLRLSDDVDTEKGEFEKALMEFPKVFELHWLNRMRRKLGLFDHEESDGELVDQWFQYLQNHELDYTLSFRSLSQFLSTESILDPLVDDEGLREFLSSWLKRVDRQEAKREAIAKQMDEINPWIVPRNHLVEEVIELSLKGDDTMFKDMLKAVVNPFSINTEFDKFSRAPSVEQRVQKTFCGT